MIDIIPFDYFSRQIFTQFLKVDLKVDLKAIDFTFKCHLDETQFRWLNINGMDAAISFPITLFLNHPK